MCVPVVGSLSVAAFHGLGDACLEAVVESSGLVVAALVVAVLIRRQRQRGEGHGD